MSWHIFSEISGITFGWISGKVIRQNELSTEHVEALSLSFWFCHFLQIIISPDLYPLTTSQLQYWMLLGFRYNELLCSTQVQTGGRCDPMLLDNWLFQLQMTCIKAQKESWMLPFYSRTQSYAWPHIAVDTGELTDSSSADIRTSLSGTTGNTSFRSPWAYYLHASNICWGGLTPQSLNEKEVWQALRFSSYKITVLWDEFSVSQQKI